MIDANDARSWYLVHFFHDRSRLMRTQAAELRERSGVATFASTLKISRAQMWDETLEAMAIAEVKFRDWHCPDTRQAVLDCLCEVINTCNALSIPFPAIFLLRQQQLADGEFFPRRISAPLFGGEK